LPATTAYSAAVEQRVDELWREQTRVRGPSLVDGQIFSVGDPDAGVDEIHGSFLAYRYYAAQRIDASLRTSLRVRPLAVTGIVRCADGLVVGQRAATSTQSPGEWDFLPAGGIDPDALLADGYIDPALQLRKELREELGVELDARAAPRPLWRMTENGLIDLVFGIELTQDRAQIERGFARLGHAEHSAIDFIAAPDVLRALRGARHFSASCRALLGALAHEKGSIEEVSS
jgi:8-oxo-dGTP pyrophosphatase MutT (NUDIX family)